MRSSISIFEGDKLTLEIGDMEPDDAKLLAEILWKYTKEDPDITICFNPVA